MIFLSFSLLSARLFSRGDESYERVVAWRMGEKKREKKEEVEGNKRDLRNNIRRKWIQTR